MTAADTNVIFRVPLKGGSEKVAQVKNYLGCKAVKRLPKAEESF